MNWLFWVFFALVLLFGFVVFRGAPYVPSHKKQVARAFAHLYTLSKKDLLVDVGSGDGVILKFAAERSARAVGYELNPALVLISRLRLFKYPQTRVRFGDFWLAELPRETTIIYAFIVTRDAKKFAGKVQREATRLGKTLAVISYANQLPDLNLTKTEGAHFLYTVKPLREEPSLRIMSSMHKREAGAVSTLLITTVILSIAVAAFGVLAIWALVNYNTEKNTVDSQISANVAAAVKDKADSDAAAFEAKEKQPFHQFVGPDDYGRLTFDYPKTWSVYVSSDVASDGDTYKAYLNPVSVPPVGDDSQQFALRVTIEEDDYGDVVSDYASLVTNGKLKSSSVTSNGVTGTRLDGQFSDNIRGSAVIFKIRDKTAIIQTDADTFETDFNTLVPTIKFNQ